MGLPLVLRVKTLEPSSITGNDVLTVLGKNFKGTGGTVSSVRAPEVHAVGTPCLSTPAFQCAPRAARHPCEALLQEFCPNF